MRRHVNGRGEKCPSAFFCVRLRDRAAGRFFVRGKLRNLSEKTAKDIAFFKSLCYNNPKAVAGLQMCPVSAMRIAEQEKRGGAGNGYI